jgi:hypothetical protein
MWICNSIFTDAFSMFKLINFQKKMFENDLKLKVSIDQLQIFAFFSTTLLANLSSHVKDALFLKIRVYSES